MNRREALVGASALGVSSLVAARGAVSPVAPLPRPVLLIDLDDLGHETLKAAMASGGAPQLRRAFALGRSYDAFWAAPNCSVFRARALTGLDAYRPGNLVGRIVGSQDKSFDGPTGTWLPSGLAGRKVKIGKWHCSGSNSFPQRLIVGGYDEFRGTRGNLNEGGSGYHDWLEWSADSSSVSSGQQTQFSTTRLSLLTLQELALGSEFVHVSYHAIHEPLAQPPDGEPSGHAYFGTTAAQLQADMLFHLDHWLGVVLGEAWQRGYVILLACDNGTSGEGKGTHKESGICTPLLVLGHDVKAGRSARLVQATDLWATVRRLCGDTSGAAALDSRDFCDDFLPVSPIAPARSHLTVDWFPYLGVSPPASTWSRAIRDARWKYVDQKLAPSGNVLDPVVGLWDLRADPYEQVNLLSSSLSPEAQAALDDLLQHLP
jgi:arylsulfatase A-like enzyme